MQNNIVNNNAADQTPTYSPYKNVNGLFKIFFSFSIIVTLCFLLFSFLLSPNLSSDCVLCGAPRDIVFFTTLMLSGALHIGLTAIYLWLLCMVYLQTKFNLSRIRVFIVILLQALAAAFVWFYFSLQHY